MDFKVRIKYYKFDKSDETITCARYTVEGGFLRLYKPEEYEDTMEHSINASDIKEFDVVSISEDN